MVRFHGCPQYSLVERSPEATSRWSDSIPIHNFMSEAAGEHITKHPIKRLEKEGKKDFAYKTAQKSLKLIIEKIWGDKFKISGLENIPTTGPAIIAANHPSHLDDMFMIAKINRPMHFVGRQDKEFNPPQVRLTYPLFGVISAPRNILKEGGKKFTRQIEEVVRNEELMCIYPEKLYVEERENKDEVGEFASGVVHIAKKYNLPIVPIFINGTQNVRPNSKATNLFQSIHVEPVEITIGNPIASYEIQNAEQIRKVIIKLKK